MSHTPRSSRLTERPRPDEEPVPGTGAAGGTPAATAAGADAPQSGEGAADTAAPGQAAGRAAGGGGPDAGSGNPAEPPATGPARASAPDTDDAPDGFGGDAQAPVDGTERTAGDEEAAPSEEPARPETATLKQSAAGTRAAAETPAAAPSSAGAGEAAPAVGPTAALEESAREETDTADPPAVDRAADPEPPEGSPERPGRGRLRGWRTRYPRAARGVTVGTSVLAGVLVLFALVVPNRLERLDVAAFLRIPAEGVLLAALLLALPARARRITSYAAGALLGLLTVLKFVDMGFYSVLVRPFDLVLDWSLFGNAADWVRESFGRTGEVVAVIAAVVLVVALLALMALAVVRLTDVMVRHRPAASRTILVLGTAWITCVVLGVQVAGVPVAAQLDARLVQDRVRQVQAGLQGRAGVRPVAIGGRVRRHPARPAADRTARQGRHLHLHRELRPRAVEDPAMARRVDAGLAEGHSGCARPASPPAAAGCSSPTTGAGSWLAHSTFLSGLWINNQQRYRSLTASDRMHPHQRLPQTGAWRTVGIMPGVPAPGRRASSSASTTSTTPSTSATRAPTSAGRPCPTSTASRPSSAWSTARSTASR